MKKYLRLVVGVKVDSIFYTSILSFLYTPFSFQKEIHETNLFYPTFF